MDFSVDPDALRAAGRTVAASAVHAADVARRHRSVGSGDAAAWGQGAAARLGALHQELVTATGEALDVLAAVLERDGTGLTRMGATYAAADGDAGAGFARIADGLP